MVTDSLRSTIRLEMRETSLTREMAFFSASHLTVAPVDLSDPLKPKPFSAQTINIQWLNASNVAIDNITFNVRDANPVPEPATMVSWLLGVVLWDLWRIVDVVWRVARLANRRVI